MRISLYLDRIHTAYKFLSKIQVWNHLFCRLAFETITRWKVPSMNSYGMTCIIFTYMFTFWEWHLNTFLRRWLYTPIIIWQGDWIPRVLYGTNVCVQWNHGMIHWIHVTWFFFWRGINTSIKLKIPNALSMECLYIYTLGLNHRRCKRRKMLEHWNIWELIIASLEYIAHGIWPMSGP